MLCRPAILYLPSNGHYPLAVCFRWLNNVPTVRLPTKMLTWATPSSKSAMVRVLSWKQRKLRRWFVNTLEQAGSLLGQAASIFIQTKHDHLGSSVKIFLVWKVDQPSMIRCFLSHHSLWSNHDPNTSYTWHTLILSVVLLHHLTSPASDCPKTSPVRALLGLCCYSCIEPWLLWPKSCKNMGSNRTHAIAVFSLSWVMVKQLSHDKILEKHWELIGKIAGYEHLDAECSWWLSNSKPDRPSHKLRPKHWVKLAFIDQPHQQRFDQQSFRNSFRNLTLGGWAQLRSRVPLRHRLPRRRPSLLLCRCILRSLEAVVVQKRHWPRKLWLIWRLRLTRHKPSRREQRRRNRREKPKPKPR